MFLRFMLKTRKKNYFNQVRKNKKYLLQFCFSSEFILIFTLENKTKTLIKKKQIALKS